MNRYQINEGEKYLNEREIKVVEEEENDDNILLSANWKMFASLQLEMNNTKCILSQNKLQ